VLCSSKPFASILLEIFTIITTQSQKPKALLFLRFIPHSFLTIETKSTFSILRPWQKNPMKFPMIFPMKKPTVFTNEKTIGSVAKEKRRFIGSNQWFSGKSAKKTQ